MASDSTKGICTVTKDWPKKGVTYFGMEPWLQNPVVFKADCLAIAKRFSHLGVTDIAYLGSRGFLMTKLSELLNATIVLVRKKGELPPPVLEETYSGEYRDNVTIVMTEGKINKHSRVLVVDDLLATGGTAKAAIKLIERSGGHVVGLAFWNILEDLSGIDVIKSHRNDLIVVSPYVVRDGVFSKSAVLDNHVIPGQLSVLDEPLHEGDDRAVVMYHDEVVEQARDLVQKFPSCFVGAPIKIDRFPDGHYDIQFNANLVGRHLVYCMSLLKPEETFHQLELLIALGRQHIKSFTVLITYFAPGTKERVDQPGELARAQTTAQLISDSLKAIPMKGPATVIIYDIHALQEQFYFSDSCSLALQSSMSLMGKLINDQNMLVVFPDQGAFKRFGKEPLLKNVPTLICNKERGPNDTRTIVISDRKNTENIGAEQLLEMHVVVVDDIVNSGGTAHETYLALKKIGFKKISLYATHAVFPNQAWMSFLPGGNRAGFDRIYTTNSVPSVTERFLKNYPETFTVLDLTPLTARFICTKYNIKPSKFVPPAKVWFATTSRPKVEAIRRVFPSAKFLAGTDTSSGVNPQPMGVDEIKTGVTNRMDHLVYSWKTSMSPKTCPVILIAIESGLVEVESGVYRDKTCILVHAYDISGALTADRMYCEGWSFKTGPIVPQWVIDVVAKSNFQKTAGQVICEKYPEQQLDESDWYNAVIEGVVNDSVMRVDHIAHLMKNASEEFDGHVDHVTIESKVPEKVTAKGNSNKIDDLASVVQRKFDGIMGSETWTVEEAAQSKVFGSARGLFDILSKVREKMSNLNQPETFSAVYGTFKKYLSKYADFLKLKLDAANLVSQKEILCCIMINTGEYCCAMTETIQMVLRIENSNKFKSAVDLEPELGKFALLAERSRGILTNLIAVAIDPAFVAMGKIRWDTLQSDESVTNTSPYVSILRDYVKDRVPVFAKYIMDTNVFKTNMSEIGPNHFQIICQSISAYITDRFRQALHFCKHITSSDAQQLIFDLAQIKRIVESLPTLHISTFDSLNAVASSSSSSDGSSKKISVVADDTYLQNVQIEFEPIEKMLKAFCTLSDVLVDTKQHKSV